MGNKAWVTGLVGTGLCERGRCKGGFGTRVGFGPCEREGGEDN